MDLIYNMEESAGKNIFAAPIVVSHRSLKRVDDSPHKSICPVCKLGYLLMRRHNETHLLLNKDNCILCGQMVTYSDVPDNELYSLQTGD